LTNLLDWIVMFLISAYLEISYIGEPKSEHWWFSASHFGQCNPMFRTVS